MSLNLRNKSKQIQRPRPQNTYVRKSKNNIDLSDQLNDNNFDNYNEIHLFDDNNNSNNFDDICFFDDEDNNSYNSYLSENDNSDNNSNYSNNIYLFEDSNNSDYSNLFEDDNNSDIEIDISEETNFKNITSLMMFTWITKHMIGNYAYKDL
ncbi:218_t:CDS:1, partial [Diversispora eburnea]